MLNFDDGIKIARNLIRKDPIHSYPESLGDEMLSLIVFCFIDEESENICLPVMLVVHHSTFQEPDNKESNVEFFYKKFKIFKESCYLELEKRYQRLEKNNFRDSGNILDFKSFASVRKKDLLC